MCCCWAEREPDVERGPVELSSHVANGTDLLSLEPLTLMWSTESDSGDPRRLNCTTSMRSTRIFMSAVKRSIESVPVHAMFASTNMTAAPSASDPP